MEETITTEQETALKKLLISSVVVMHAINKYYLNVTGKKSGISYAIFEDGELQKAYEGLSPELGLVMLEEATFEAVDAGVLNLDSIETFAEELNKQRKSMSDKPIDTTPVDHFSK